MICLPLRPPPPSTLQFLSLLVALVQLQYNGKQNSPFEIHPIILNIAVVSLILYVIIVHEVSHWLPSNSNSLSRINLARNLFAAISRNTVFICIATILLPDKIKPYFYIPCSFILTAITVYSIFKLLRHPPPEQTSVWRRMLSPTAWLVWVKERFNPRHGDGLLPATGNWRCLLGLPDSVEIWGKEVPAHDSDGGHFI
nr:uncharacterized protein LOC107817788 [Ipomoea batatas]